LGASTTPRTLATWLEASFERVSDVPFIRIDDPALHMLTGPLRTMLVRPVDPRRIERAFEIPLAGQPRTPDMVRQVFVPLALAEIVYSAHRQRLVSAFEYLQIPHEATGHVRLSEYDLMRILCRKYDGVDALISDVSRVCGFAPGSVELFCLRKFLFHNNVVLRRQYRDILYEVDVRSGELASGRAPIAKTARVRLPQIV
jgi:hypothetical protein